MFLPLIRRACANPHGRRSPLSVETRAATLESSMHPTDNTCLYFDKRHTYLLYNELVPFPPLPDIPVMNFYEKQSLYDYANFPATWNSSCSRDCRNPVRMLETERHK